MIADADDPKQVLQALKEAVRRAWQTLAQVRDPDARFFVQGGAWPLPIVNDVNEAYGYSSPKAREFRPRAEDVSRMEIVMAWMAWLRRKEGEIALRRIIGWSMSVPVWQLAKREKCSERTIMNRIDRSLNAVLKEFLAMDADPDLVEEARPDLGAVRGFAAAATAVLDHPDGVRPGKVWIHGIGWMFKGKPWDRGERLSEKFT